MISWERSLTDRQAGTVSSTWLGALHAHLYGLTLEDLAYILDRFSIVRRGGEAQWREYRTERMVLGTYEELANVSSGTGVGI